MPWLEMLRNVLLALVMILSTHIALSTRDTPPPDVVVLPRAHAAQNVNVAKTTMPLDGLEEMFEYARSGDDWGHTPVILPPSQSTEPNDIVKESTDPTGWGPQEPLEKADNGVSAFDGWSGTASFP